MTVVLLQLERKALSFSIPLCSPHKHSRPHTQRLSTIYADVSFKSKPEFVLILNCIDSIGLSTDLVTHWGEGRHSTK